MKKNTCPVCGKQIKQEMGSHGGRPKRFCSPHCRNVYHCRASEARKRGFSTFVWDNNAFGNGEEKYGIFDRHHGMKVKAPWILQGIMEGAKN